MPDDKTGFNCLLMVAAKQSAAGRAFFISWKFDKRKGMVKAVIPYREINFNYII